MESNGIIDNQEMAFLDSIAAYLSTVPQPPKMLNFARMTEILAAKRVLEHIIRQNGDEPQVIVKLSPEFNMATLSARLDDFVVRDFNAFNTATATASNIEFFPLTTGQLSCAIAFKGAFITL